MLEGAGSVQFAQLARDAHTPWPYADADASYAAPPQPLCVLLKVGTPSHHGMRLSQASVSQTHLNGIMLKRLRAGDGIRPVLLWLTLHTHNVHGREGWHRVGGHDLDVEHF